MDLLKATGIIAEYNPFHNGHKYQIEQARQQTNCDVVIVVMSGNFLQRGVPAIYDKWNRANWAIQNGADIVIELPVHYSTQSADYFALGGTTLLNHLFTQKIVFGVESGSENNYLKAAQWFIEHEQRVMQNLKDKKRDKSFAQLLNETIQKEYIGFPLDLTEPNNILGFSYVKQILKNQFPLDILAIKRKQANYHDDLPDENLELASATAIRNEIRKHKSVYRYVPKTVYDNIKYLYPVQTKELWPFVQYKFWNSDEDDLSQIFEMESGLEYRFKQEIFNANSYEEFIQKTKSKHVTYNKVNRLILYTLLDMTDKKINNLIKIGPQYIRLLACNNVGRQYLNSIKSKLSIPLISNVNKSDLNLLELDIKAGELYRLLNTSKIPKQDFTRNPFETIDNKASYQYTE